MNAINLKRTPWKKVLTEYAPLVLPSAHDALTARIAERTGFKAIQVGGTPRRPAQRPPKNGTPGLDAGS